MAFDPDTYLMEKTGEMATDSGDFDPDKYLAEKEPAPEPTPEPAKPERSGIGALPGDLGKRIDTIGKNAEKYSAGNPRYYRRQAGQVAGVINDFVNRGIQTVEKPVGAALDAAQGLVDPESLKRDKENMARIGKGIFGSAPAQATGEAIAAAKKSHPELMQDIGDVANIFLTLPIGAAAKMVERPVGKALGLGLSAEEKYVKALKPGISKGIKPTVVGKKSLARHDKFYTDADQALRTIAENKNAISVVDSKGLPVSHPKTAAQAAQAIDQAKKIVYKKYNDMAVAAGDAGASFKSNKVLSRLDEIAQAPDEVIPKNDPRLKWDESIRRYAHDMKASVAELDGASPEIIEARIQDLNNSLKGYYEGRTAAAKAQIDGSVAQAMREELDANITSAVGDGYQALKNQYGALKSIEKEVNHRAIVNARKNTAGLTDLTDVFTGGELVAGVMTANPALIAKAVAGREIKEHIKKFNDPDLYVERMFKRAYGLPEAVSGSTVADFAAHGVADVKGLQSPTFARKGAGNLDEAIAALNRNPTPAELLKLAENLTPEERAILTRKAESFTDAPLQTAYEKIAGQSKLEPQPINPMEGVPQERLHELSRRAANEPVADALEAAQSGRVPGTRPTSEDPFAGRETMSRKELSANARADAAFTPETDLPMDAIKGDPRYSYEQMNILDEASTAAESAVEKSAGQLSISASKALGREVFGGQVPLALTDAKRGILERIAEASNTMFESNPAQWHAEYGAKGFPARADVNADDLFHMISAPGDASATAGRKVSDIVDKRLSDQVKPGQSVADFVAESQKKGATPAGKKTGTMADRLRTIGANAARRLGNERGAVGGAFATPRRYEYDLQYRPFGTATVPKGYVDVSKTKNEFGFETVSYDKPLSRKDQEAFQLSPKDPQDPVNIKKAVESARNSVDELTEYGEKGYESVSSDGTKRIYTPDVREGGDAWRVTYINKDGTPTGHVPFKSYVEARDEIARNLAYTERTASPNSGAFSAANPDIRGSGAVPMMAGMAAAGIGGATAYHVFMKKREQARNKKK